LSSVEKVTNTIATTGSSNAHDDASSCSSTGAGEGSSTSSSTIMTRSSLSTTADLDSLPPNKRRLRERNTTIFNPIVPPIIADPLIQSSNTNSNMAHSPVDTMPTREIPINAIKQFLEIRQQVTRCFTLRMARVFPIGSHN
jgi:hypothetical protein